jgi:hypothetical protein
MTDLDRYLDYLDATYDVIVKHLAEKRLPVTDERIRLYFTALVRPYYFWAQEEKPLPEEKQPKEAKPITEKQIEYLQKLRSWKKHNKTDEELRKMSSYEASVLIESCGGKKQ